MALWFCPDFLEIIKTIRLLKLYSMSKQKKEQKFAISPVTYRAAMLNFTKWLP